MLRDEGMIARRGLRSNALCNENAWGKTTWGAGRMALHTEYRVLVLLLVVRLAISSGVVDAAPAYRHDGRALPDPRGGWGTTIPSSNVRICPGWLIWLLLHR
jgi:hypothetical protein